MTATGVLYSSHSVPKRAILAFLEYDSCPHFITKRIFLYRIPRPWNQMPCLAPFGDNRVRNDDKRAGIPNYTSEQTMVVGSPNVRNIRSLFSPPVDVVRQLRVRLLE